MSEYRDWKPNSPVTNVDTERWDDKVSPADLRATAVDWLNGSTLGGFTFNSAINQVVGTYYMKAPFNPRLVGNTSWQVVSKDYVTPPLNATGGSQVNRNYTDQQIVDLGASSGVKTIAEFSSGYMNRTTDTTLTPITSVFDFAFDVKAYLKDNYAELLTSTSPTWSQIVAMVQKYNIVTTIGLGGLYLKSLDDSNPLIGTQSRLLFTTYVENTATMPAEVQLGSTEQASPLGNYSMSYKELQKFCTKDGVLYIRAKPYYTRYSAGSVAIKGMNQNVALVSSSGMTIGASTDFSFYETFMLKKDFNAYVSGSTIGLSDASYMGLDMTSTTSSVDFGNSPVRHLVSGIYYKDPLNKTTATRYTLADFKSTDALGTDSAYDGMIVTGRTTAQLRVPMATGTGNKYDNDGRVNPDSSSYDWYQYQLNPAYSYHAGGYLIANFLNGIQYQGWEFDWVKFFEINYPGIFTSSMTRADKVTLIKTKIKPTASVQYLNLRCLYETQISYTEANNNGYFPANYRQCLFTNTGDNLTRSGSYQTMSTSSYFDSSTNFGFKTYSSDWSSPLTGFNNTYITTSNIDSEGYTYHGMANWNWYRNRAYSTYAMGKFNSPIVYTISFRWGLREIITVVTGGVTQASMQAEIQSLQNQIDALKG